jgi:hypothetical protein
MHSFINHKKFLVILMSLVTLTFGEKRSSFISTPHAVVSTPEARLRQSASREGTKGKAVIKKACRFFSQEDVYVLAQVDEGFVSDEMKAFYNGSRLQVIDVESKLGQCAKQGMSVGLTFRGVNEFDFMPGSIINFEK